MHICSIFEEGSSVLVVSSAFHSNAHLFDVVTDTTQDYRGLVTFFEAREIEIPFYCNFCTG